MGTMNSLRENTGVILWILVISFGLIWTLQDSNMFETVGQQGTNIMVVDGDPVPVETYNQAVQNQVQTLEQRRGEPLAPQERDMVEEQVFDMLVEDRLRQREMDRLGITVTDEEVYDMVLGDNPHPIITANFGDAQGNVDQNRLRSFIDAPEARDQWLQIEDYLRQDRRRQKLDKLIQASVHVSEQDVIEEYFRRNASATARYIALRYAAIPNDSVEVTESDLSDFYDRNREDYRRERTYTLDYVTLSKEATAADTAAVTRELEQMRNEFAQAENDSLFLARNYSVRPYTKAYFTRADLEPAVADAVFDNLEEGAVVGPVQAGGQVHLIKINDVRPADESILRARHILIRSEGEGDEALEQARNLKQRLQEGADFAQLARQHSDDGTAARGGDLGWFGQGRMVPAFEEAAFAANVGEIVGPVETRFGYHLIEVTDRSNREVQIADFALDVRPDRGSLQDAQEKLGDLTYFTEESGNFQQEAERLDLDVQQVQVEADQQQIPGIGVSRRLQSFLDGAQEGAISDVIELNDRFLVASVREVQEEGYRPFDDVRSELEPRVYREKKAQIQTQRLQDAMADDDFDQIGPTVGAPIRTASNVTMQNPVVPGLGREPRFVGTAFGLEEGETSRVIEGENAAFVLRLQQLNEPEPITEQQRQQIRQQLLQQRRQQVQQQWIAGLRDEADIRDYRSRFFQ